MFYISIRWFLHGLSVRIGFHTCWRISAKGLQAFLVRAHSC